MYPRLRQIVSQTFAIVFELKVCVEVWSARLMCDSQLVRTQSDKS